MDLTLERELTELEVKLEAAAKSAKSALSELKKATVSAKIGQIRDLNKGLAEARNAAKRFADDVAGADSSWKFDAEAYFANGGYLTELLREAESAGLSLFQQDGRVFCFPMLLTLSAKDIAVMIDRKPERRLRPRELVKLLSARQRRPQRLNEQKFLETLFDAYCFVARSNKSDWTRDTAGVGPVVSLLAIHELLTILPGVERDYPKEEFARDVHLLDRQPNLRTKDGRRLALPASTGTKNIGQRLTIIDQQGREVVYVGIRFDKG
jgi:hypothetical protein